MALATWEPGAAESILARLTAAHRIEQYRPGRYRFHDLVGEYARRKAEDAFDETALQRLREQVVDWYATAYSGSLPVGEYRNIVSTFLEWNGHPTVSRLLTRLKDFAAAGYRDEPAEKVYELPSCSRWPRPASRPAGTRPTRWTRCAPTPWLTPSPTPAATSTRPCGTRTSGWSSCATPRAATPPASPDPTWRRR
ncbi:hypothetical protein GCM10029992_62230 [Glycomyces albus]